MATSEIKVLESACSRQMTLKITQDRQNHRYSIGHTSVPISTMYVVTTLILYSFRGITTFTVYAYVTACDLKKSFTFEKTVVITSHVSSSSIVNIS